MKFIKERIKEGDPIRAPELVKSIKEEFNKEVHPRSIERAITRRKNSKGKKK